MPNDALAECAMRMVIVILMNPNRNSDLRITPFLLRMKPSWQGRENCKWSASPIGNHSVTWLVEED